jgi:hypothetical protein
MTASMASRPEAPTINSLALIGLKAGSDTFDLSSDMSNISIRDQVVRARLLVRDLNGLPLRPKHVLVVGAGFAGISAALACQQAGMSVTVVDTNDEPFKLQARPNDRWVGPLMYEWPMYKSENQTYPPGVIPILADESLLGELWKTLANKEDPLRAQDLAASARGALEKIHASQYFPIYLEVDRDEVKAYVMTFSATSAPARTNLTLSKAQSWPKGSPPPLLNINCPDVIILGGGVGDEKVELDAPPEGTKHGKAAGMRFWDVDNWLNESADEDVGVFGAGDGALQDVLRALTGRDHPLQTLKQICAKSTVAKSKLLGVESELLAVELEGRWAATWTQLWEIAPEKPTTPPPPGAPPPPRLLNHRGHIDSWTDERCRVIAQDLAADPSVRDAVGAIIRSGSGSVHHVYFERYFTKSYLLNRFLIHLIAACQSGRGPYFVGKMKYKGWPGTPNTYGIKDATAAKPFHIWLRKGKDVSSTSDELDLHRIAVRYGVKREELPGRQLVGLSESDIAERTAVGQVSLPVVAFPMEWK